MSQTIAVITGQVFHGKPATDYQSTEIDTSPTQAITTNTDNYLQFPATAGNIVNIGFHSDDSNGVDLDVQYPSGNGITGEVPLTPVSPGWVNTASTILAETSPDGTSINETINADGSYSLSESAVAGPTTATQNSDSTGTATVPVVGFFGPGVGTATQITIPLQSGGTINFTLNAVGAVVAPIVIPVSAWYPVSPTLASDATTNLGIKTIPAGCVSAGFGTSGIELTQQQSRLDTIFGISDTKVTNTWVTTVGPVCEQINESMNIYYDFSGQDGGVLLGGPGPIQTNSITELVGLSTAARAADKRRPAPERTATTFAGRVAFAQARLERWRLAIRTQQIRKLQDFVKRGYIK